MAQVYNKLQIDVHGAIHGLATPVQNDANSRFLDVVLLDNGTAINLTGHEVRIYCKKPENGGEIYNNGEITDAVNGRCQFPLTDQTLAKVGYVEAQIIIYYQNVQTLQTHVFQINVVKSLMSQHSIESSNEYGALVILFQNIYEAYDLMTTMVQNIGVPKEIAEQLSIETMWEAWEYLCNYISEDLTTLLQNAINNNSVDGVVQRIGNTADTGGSATAGTAMAKLNVLLDYKAGIKSIQRGVVTGTQNSYQYTVDIPISAVNANRCVALVDHAPNGTSAGHGVCLNSLTSTSLLVTISNQSVKVSWQVIEFY